MLIKFRDGTYCPIIKVNEKLELIFFWETHYSKTAEINNFKLEILKGKNSHYYEFNCDPEKAENYSEIERVEFN